MFLKIKINENCFDCFSNLIIISHNFYFINHLSNYNAFFYF